MNVKNRERAFVLCGGKSSRMGTDKGLALYRGKEMVCHVIDVLQPLFSEVVLIANNPAYTKFGLPVFHDLISGTGPMGGIYTGLINSDTPWNFFIACDMPFITDRVIGKLQNETDVGDAIVALHNNLQEPLCTFYNKSCISFIEKQMAVNNFKLQDLISILRVKNVDVSGTFLPGQDPFRNINTLDELININKL